MAQSFCLRCAKVLGMGGVGGRTAWTLRMPLNCPLKNSYNGKFYEYFTAAKKEKERRNEHCVTCNCSCQLIYTNHEWCLQLDCTTNSFLTREKGTLFNGFWRDSGTLLSVSFNPSSARRPPDPGPTFERLNTTGSACSSQMEARTAQGAPPGHCPSLSSL